MSTATFDELTKYRWSSDDETDRFAVANPATGDVITTIQGGGAKQMNAAVDAAHHRLVIIEFATMEQLRAWYNSPEYGAARSIAKQALRRTLAR